MSFNSYTGCDTFVVSAGTPGFAVRSAQGTLVAVNVNFNPTPQPGYVNILDSNLSTANTSSSGFPPLLYEVVLHSSGNLARQFVFVPTIPIKFRNGLFINTSNTNSVIVNYISLGNAR